MESLNYDVYEGVEMMKCPGCSAFCYITSHPQSFGNKSEEIPCEREVYLFLRSNVQSIVYHDIMNIILSNRNERLMKQINNS